MKKDRYYDRAESWAVDTRADAARSRRIAWTVAGVAVGVAAFEALALALLAPLKTVQPITLLVDRQTGFVQALDPLTPKRVTADAALTQSFLAQYVAAREGFDRATVAVDYRKVALWSTDRARSGYLSQMPATNPASPFQRYPAGTVVTATVKSVSRLEQGTALVRFDTQVIGRGGQASAAQAWISVVRFRFSDAPMSLSDRLVNPLGFQVTGYRRDAEAVPAAAVTTAVVAEATAPATTPTANEPARVIAAVTRPRQSPTTRRAEARRREEQALPIPVVPAGAVREVPLNQLPMGSPLSGAIG
jgi:type IV secretion system protein VirB8